MERVLSKVDQSYALLNVQMSSSFVGDIHLTVRGLIYVSVPRALVHGKGKLDSI